VTHPGRSTAVAELAENDVRAARDVVAAMHALAARLAAPRLDSTHLEEMAAANARFAAAIESGDGPASLAADDAFHGVLVTCAGNPAIAGVLDQ